MAVCGEPLGSCQEDTTKAYGHDAPHAEALAIERSRRMRAAQLSFLQNADKISECEARALLGNPDFMDSARFRKLESDEAVLSTGLLAVSKPPDVRIDVPRGSGRNYPGEETLADWVQEEIARLRGGPLVTLDVHGSKAKSKADSSCGSCIDGKLRWINQLDHATSGVMLVGLSKKTASTFGKEWQARRVLKFYDVIVRGVMPSDFYDINLPLADAYPGSFVRRAVIGQPMVGDKSNGSWKQGDIKPYVRSGVVGLSSARCNDGKDLHDCEVDVVHSTDADEGPPLDDLSHGVTIRDPDGGHELWEHESGCPGSVFFGGPDENESSRDPRLRTVKNRNLLEDGCRTTSSLLPAGVKVESARTCARVLRRGTYRIKQEGGAVLDVPVTLMRVRIFTGRSHQIRAHLFAIGYPVLGDCVYTEPNLRRALAEARGEEAEAPVRSDLHDSARGPLPWRMFLHSRRVELPELGVRLEADSGFESLLLRED
eukprot:g1631.t1